MTPSVAEPVEGAADAGLREFRATVRAWIAEHVPPFVADPAHRDLDQDRLGLRWEQYLYAAGWGAPGWPSEYGGMGLTATQQVVYYEELANAAAPGETNRPGKRTFAPTLMAFGTPQQKSRFLPPILAATEVWCQGFSEPGAGSDLAAIRTSARPDGNGLLVSGQKTWSSNAAFADFMFALVRTEQTASRHDGLSLVVIDMRAEGVDVRPITKLTGQRDFCDVFLDDVRIGREDVVGPLGEGWSVAVGALTHERVINMVPRVVDMARETAAAKKLANSLQDASFLSEAVAAEDMAHVLRAACYRAVSVPVADSSVHGSWLKLAWSEAHQAFLRRTLDRVTEHVARGTVDRSTWQQWHAAYLEARAETIYAGTSEVQRNIISRRRLGLGRR